MSTSTTSIRVATETRDRLNSLVEELDQKSVEALLNYLMDEHWKARCILQADLWRDNNPTEWREELREAGWQDQYWSTDLRSAA
jgi:hypothetical protein